MTRFLHRDEKRYSLAEAIQASISSYLYDAYAADFGLLGDLDRWTQRRITDENMAKLALVLEAEDATEACYRDLIREIDIEAESGIYLVKPGAADEHLQRLLGDAGGSDQQEGRALDEGAAVSV